MPELIEMEKNEANKQWAIARSRVGRGAALVGTALTAGLAAGVASAADHTVAIGDAFTDASGNVTAAALGVIALVAVVVGLGLIVSIMRR
ncbi:hypothetical protein [Marinobacter sp. KMM 10035]|uniref:hypothetical protein n=1 Tax=Marinobacter sp. KMM 10035 TaxID=3134034 RepID=UPI00397AAC6C